MKNERPLMTGPVALRLAGEFVIIVAGVLVALAVDQWNRDRLDRSEEREIIERLISDMEVDVRGIESGLSVLPRKEQGLQRADSVLGESDGRPQDPVIFLSDVIYGAQYGWNQFAARRTTFDELLGSGAFSLIRETELRESISDYYAAHLTAQNRIDERETEYPHLSYRFVPRSEEFELALGLSETQVERLVSGIFESSLREHVISEINLAGFIATRFEELLQEALELLSELEAYRGRVE